MTYFISHSMDAPSLNQELVRDRIRMLHREAEEHRRAADIQRLRRARRDVERASARLRNALLRLA
ncbi:hypothetical protein [Planomonospora venezuelensis]|uniref:Uncharacterized protein n=1 Tax=Planomonospora venezuelensis TaxID=1999 RepID=A0A841D369_PLAVE|nr:hypothetical protein [Planomonospora venezuelensis]MBB5962954.1 hypothetical protein [Planomonospora venezuelensis]GIN04572.1 hypothetical protein Pve01_62300 [Planomonospora venezuelensis]